ncbi:MAG: hypothetical protein ABIL76_07010 [candidate division WOR-3 bacterium]
MLALIGIINAGPDDNSRDGPYYPFNNPYKTVLSTNINPTTKTYLVKANEYSQKINFKK